MTTPKETSDSTRLSEIGQKAREASGKSDEHVVLLGDGGNDGVIALTPWNPIGNVPESHLIRYAIYFVAETRQFGVLPMVKSGDRITLYDPRVPTEDELAELVVRAGTTDIQHLDVLKNAALFQLNLRESTVIDNFHRQQATISNARLRIWDTVRR